jgi:hypothetical protein
MRMTRGRHILFAVLCLGIVTVASLAAQQSNTDGPSMPHLVRFTGVLKDINGKAALGIVGVTFAFYKDEHGGVALWTETQNVTPDASGHYSVMLGATKRDGLPAELFTSNEARWLGIDPQGLPAPARVLLLAVPYALKAGDAETIGGFPPSAFVLAAPTNVASSPKAASNAGTPLTTSVVTTSGGNVNLIPLWSTGTDIENSGISQSGTGTTVKIGIGTTSPATTLDVKGAATIRGTESVMGTLSLPATGVATATVGKSSQPANLAASSFNSSNSTAVTQTFQLKAEPAGNNTAAPGGTLNLLFGASTATPGETGLKVASNGQITFATGQKFPGTGKGTITGVTAGTDLTGGGTSGTVTVSLDTTKIPQLNAANIFTASQRVLGDLTSNGLVSGSVVNALSSFNLSGNPFAFGSMNTGDSYFGFAGNQTGTGSDNVGVGQIALLSNTTGHDNTAAGVGALKLNTSGSDNSADGLFALSANTSGSLNTAIGSNALVANTIGSNNTAVGAHAGPDSVHPNLTNATAIGANAQVTASNSLVLGSVNGVNGATADTLVGIGTTAPTAKLDVRGNANFTGPITFAAGQTFPGAGTITGVTAGSGLSGGGTSGTVALSLNTSFSDGRYAQLVARNIFSGVQVINNNVGIGIAAPTFPLQVSGTMRGDGLSLSSSGNLNVDAPFVSGGRLTVLANGFVGIDNPSPTTNLDVHGNIDASGALIGGSLSVSGGGIINGGLTTSAGITTGAGVNVGGPLNVTGGLTIKNDQTMNAAPHMYFGGFFPGNIVQTQVGGYVVPSKDILITRVTLGGGGLGLNFSGGCSPTGTIGIINISGGLSNLVPVYLLNIVQNSDPSYRSDSGPVSVPVAGGTPLVFDVWVGPVCGLNPGPNNLFLSVEYVMQ